MGYISITEALKKSSIRESIAGMLVSFSKPLYLILRRNRQPWKITMESLSQMKVNTLGYDLYLFLSKNNLTIMPRAEFHDVYHVLFEYGTDMKGETKIQFVPLGNGRTSMPFLISTFVSAIFYPEHWEEFYKAFKRGRNANTFHNWNFEELLNKKTTEIRKMMFEKG